MEFNDNYFLITAFFFSETLLLDNDSDGSGLKLSHETSSKNGEGEKIKTPFNWYLILFQITPGDIETGSQMLRTSAALKKDNSNTGTDG